MLSGELGSWHPVTGVGKAAVCRGGGTTRTTEMQPKPVHFQYVLPIHFQRLVGTPCPESCDHKRLDAISEQGKVRAGAELFRCTEYNFCRRKRAAAYSRASPRADTWEECIRQCQGLSPCSSTVPTRRARGCPSMSRPRCFAADADDGAESFASPAPCRRYCHCCCCCFRAREAAGWKRVADDHLTPAGSLCKAE